MDIKSWILVIGTSLIIAVICHGFWTAYRARKNDVRMDIETDLPEGDLDDLVWQSGELPNGGARVTPTVGYDALLVKELLVKKPLSDIDDDQKIIDPIIDPLDEALLSDAEAPLVLDQEADEGNVDAGYHPEQATLDLESLDNEMNALEERYAARAAASEKPVINAEKTALPDVPAVGADFDFDFDKDPDVEIEADADIDAEIAADAQTDEAAPLPPKKLIEPDLAGPPRKQFEPPYPEELERERLAEEQRALEAKKLEEQERLEAKQAAIEHAERRRLEIAAAAEAQAAREAEYQAKVEAQRLRKEQEAQREAQAKLDAEARAKARAAAKEAAAVEAKARTAEAARSEPEQLSLTSEPIVEFPEPSVRQSDSQPAVEELVVLNVVAKTRPFHGGDVLELFLRNGIKFGDMNIFHRINSVTKESQYSIASVTEPGYFDLRTMESLEFRGLCLFMQLPCSGQATKVFTDMLTVADKLATQLDAEVCDEQFNRLTRQSTEHYRQRVAEFTRRHMSKRAL